MDKTLEALVAEIRAMADHPNAMSPAAKAKKLTRIADELAAALAARPAAEGREAVEAECWRMTRLWHTEEKRRQIEANAACERAEAELAAVIRCMNPREWTPEMDAAWHRTIPDVPAAFAALLAAARGGVK